MSDLIDNETYDYETHNLFPTTVLKTVPSESYDFTESELKFIDNIQYLPREFNNISYDINILKSPELTNLRKFVNNAVEYYLRDVLKISSNQKFKVSSSWINTEEHGQYEELHINNNSILTGVINITADNELIIYNTTHDYFPGWRFEHTEANQINSTFVRLRSSRSGTLIMFPSSIYHKTPRYEGFEERKSIIFNVFFDNGSEAHVATPDELII
ncbi:hypothetical protein S820908_136 [Synechococcus phage S-CAM9]|uniref:Uncharacterized protein n=1 Tax=Synechococcus phage S-CAM9 TaxID=1883369 RepID=A0A1D8KNR3_9CAUD|nr:2OG-Fe(II) oxygenase [Synechococcus phage S-CAM9]AOV60283.1 hypothetical protein S050808_136 [Synechococcus phage S-CAM9]AOV60511.1 hypothetical protein S820908_136 [Synechococcus phage S-CAM9]AOV60740.1 hypothetical protein N161109_137 [Synechococcus phage S-CAM9]